MSPAVYAKAFYFFLRFFVGIILLVENAALTPLPKGLPVSFAPLMLPAAIFFLVLVSFFFICPSCRTRLPCFLYQDHRSPSSRYGRAADRNPHGPAHDSSGLRKPFALWFPEPLFIQQHVAWIQVRATR